MKTNIINRLCNCMKPIIVISSMLFFFSYLETNHAQSISVVAGCKETSGIIVRWFAQEPFNVEGVNIYRKEKNENSWTKLNAVPIKRMDEADPETASEEMKLNSALIYEQPNNADDKENWRLMQITKQITDEKFAALSGMQYDDLTAELGKTYEYKVIRVVGGSETEGSISNPVKYEKYKPASSPEGMAVFTGNKTALFNWKTDKKKYFVFNVYRSESVNGDKTKINSLPIFVFSFKDKSGILQQPQYFYTDTSLTVGKTYYYSLEGIDFLGRKTAMSSPIKFIAKDLELPPTPYDIKGKVDKNKITVSWRLDITNDLKELNIYRSLRKDGGYEKINKKALAVTDNSYTDVILNPEPAYYYYVEVKNKSGNTAISEYVCTPVRDMTPPSKPMGLKGTGEIGVIQLSWKMGSDKNLLGYFIYRSISEKPDEFLLLTPYPVKLNEYADTLTKEHQNYYLYQIKAVSKTYVTSEPSEIIKVKLKDVTPPAVPTITNGYFENGKIVIEWSQLLDEDLLGFDIYRAVSSDSTKWTKINKKILGKDVKSYIDNIVTDGVYLYSITSMDLTENTSERSPYISVSVISPDTVLQAPEGLSKTVDAQNKTVKLKWNKITKQNLLGYVVFRIEDDAPVAISNMISETNFTDNQPLEGKNIYFVKAFDDSGNVSISQQISVELSK